MDGAVIAIDPVAFAVGPIVVRWYGLMIALGLASGIAVAVRESRRRSISEDTTYACAMWGMLGAVVGARLFHVVDRLDFYLQNPGAVLALQNGGLAIWGGVLGGLGVGALYCRLASIPLARMADVAAPAILIGQIVGRLGCLVNGDAYGGPLDAPWALIYAHEDALMPNLGEPSHPYPLYEMLWNAIVLGLIWQMRGRRLPDGSIFLTYVVLYSLGRLVLTSVRQEAVVAIGLQQAQIIALLLILAALPPLWRRWQTGHLRA